MTSYLYKEKTFSVAHLLYTHFAKSRLNQVSAFTKSNKEGQDQESIHNQASTPGPQDTNGRVTNSQLDITNESQEVPAVHKASINRGAQTHNKYRTEIT